MLVRAAGGTVSTNDFKNGMTVEIDGQPFRVMGESFCFLLPTVPTCSDHAHARLHSPAVCSSRCACKGTTTASFTIFWPDMVHLAAEFLHVKPGKGAAFVRSKLKNYVTGNTVERTFRAGEQVGCTQ